MDDGGGWRPARLTPEQMEERRLAAAALLRQGRLSQAAIARQLGVSGASVCRWAATLAQDGRRGLRARPRTGRPARLDAAAWARLGRLLARGRGRPASRPSNGPCGGSRRWSGASSGWPTTRATWSGR